MPVAWVHWPVSRAAREPGTDRRGAEGLTEQHALVGQVLDVRCRHRVAVGLHVAAGVVGVQIEDVGLGHTPRVYDQRFLAH